MKDCRSTLGLLLILIMGFLFASLADVPHPMLLEKIKKGEITKPYYLQNRSRLYKEGVNSPGVLPDGSNPYSGSNPAEGTFNALAILIDFSDNTSQVSASYFDNLLFGTGTGTVRDYYQEVSYGNLTIVTLNMPAAMGWQRAPQSYAYYVNGLNGFGSYPQNAQKLAEDAVALVDPIVDFSQYDNNGDGWVDALFIIHAGPGAEYTGSNDDIWSHKWNMSAPQSVDGVNAYTYSMEPEYWLSPGDMTCGVYAHEMGHAVFGLPDLYDRDYSSNGLGRWSLMAGGSWNGILGDSPAHPDIWSRVQMGYVTPTVITGNTSGVSIESIENMPAAFRLWTNGAMGNEYFLLENRQRTGYDAALPGDGLLIYHVDENVISQNDNEWYPGYTNFGHYLVALEQADGLWDLEQDINSGDDGDPFPGSTMKTTFDVGTSPDSRDYNFNATGVAVRNISGSSATMTADFEVQITGNPVTFQVDMSIQALNGNFSPALDEVVVRGAFNGWAGNNEMLSDPDGDQIYSGTFNLDDSWIGQNIEYKFVIVKSDGTDIWENINNRSFVLQAGGQVLPVVYFEDVTTYNPPDIDVTPTSLTFSVPAGGSETQQLTISNLGAEELVWNISESNWPGTSPQMKVSTHGRPVAKLQEKSYARGTSPAAVSPVFWTASRKAGDAISGPESILLFDDMESGTNGWTTLTLSGTTDDLWHQTNSNFNSPSTSWWCAVESQGNYDTGNRINNVLLSPVIDLSTATGPVTLEFYENFDTEPGWDYCMVDVTTDGGATWVPLRGVSGSGGGTGTAPSGNSGGWILSALDLTPFLGAQIQIGFHFDTVDGAVQNYPGWLIDDVKVFDNGTTDVVTWLSETPENGSILPSDSQTIDVTVDATGLVSGTSYYASLFINSNDPDENPVVVPIQVDVVGGVNPPDIDVSPTSFSFTVPEGGTDSGILTISNVALPGSADLTWSVMEQELSAAGRIKLSPANGQSDRPGPAPGENLSRRIGDVGTLAVSPLSASSTVVKAPLFRQKLSPMQTDILLIGTTALDSSIILALNELGISYDYVNTSDWTGIDFSPYNTIIIGMDGGSISTLSVEAVANAASSGKKLIMIGGSNYTPYYDGVGMYLLQHDGTTGWQISSTPHLVVTNPADPLASGLPGTYTFVDPAAAYYMLRISDPAASKVAENGDGYPALISKPVGNGLLVYYINSPYSGYYLNNADYQILKTIVQNALNYQAGCFWLSEMPTSGTVPAGSSQDVTILVDAAGLAPGTYNCNLSISSNDPDENPVVIPVQLTVSGGNIPDIEVMPASLSQFVTGDTTVVDSFQVENIGTGDLTFSITDVETSPGLKLKSVAFKRENSKGKSLASGSRDGKEDFLNFLKNSATEAGVVSWLSETPLGGTVLPGNSVWVYVTFNSTGLAPGVYSANILVSSNDPDEPTVTVPVTLNRGEINFTTDDNEDNNLTGNPDFDMDVYLFNTDPITPIEFNIFIAESVINSAQLSIYAWDIDETSGEVDEVYLNGNLIGSLTGANSQWSTSVFNVDPAFINPGPSGKNLVQIFVDVNNGGWAVNVDWGQMVINGTAGNAYIRYVNLDKNTYLPGETVSISEEIDTDLPTQDVRVETNLLDPSNINVAGTSRTITISGTMDEPFTENLTLPSNASYGTYNAQVIVYDANSNIQQDMMLVPFQVQPSTPDVVISISDTLKAVAGDTARVPVMLTLNGNSLGALGAAVKATNGILSFVGYETGPIVPGAVFNVNAPAGDSLRIGFFDAGGGPITTDGLLVTLKFLVDPTANEGDFALLNFSDLSAADPLGAPFFIFGINGKVTVVNRVTISGNILYADPAGGGNNAKPVADMDVFLTQNGAPLQSTLTNANGDYLLSDIVPGAGYCVRPRRQTGGIGTSINPTDALLAFNDFLGTVSLSGSQRLAADVDSSLAINPTDALLIFNRFLGILSNFTVDDWRAYPSDYDIDASADAWKYAPNKRCYTNLSANQSGQDFYAVISGDVSLDWAPSPSPPAGAVAASGADNAPVVHFRLAASPLRSGEKELVFRVQVDGDALQNGLFAFGGDILFDPTVMEIESVQWGESVRSKDFQLGFNVLNPLADTPMAVSESAEMQQRASLRFGGFATSHTAIRSAGSLLTVYARLKSRPSAGSKVELQFANASAAVGLPSAGFQKGETSTPFASAAAVADQQTIEIIEAPQNFVLKANYPNPFNPTTRIQYGLPEKAEVRLAIFNALGQKVRTLIHATRQDPGYYEAEWDGRDDLGNPVASGVYLYRLEANTATEHFAQTRKMLLLK